MAILLLNIRDPVWWTHEDHEGAQPERIPVNLVAFTLLGPRRSVGQQAPADPEKLVKNRSISEHGRLNTPGTIYRVEGDEMLSAFGPSLVRAEVVHDFCGSKETRVVKRRRLRCMDNKTTTTGTCSTSKHSLHPPPPTSRVHLIYALLSRDLRTESEHQVKVRCLHLCCLHEGGHYKLYRWMCQERGQAQSWSYAWNAQCRNEKMGTMTEATTKKKLAYDGGNAAFGGGA